jgi:acetoin utilization deacetylase AcuC-like enzyme
MALRVDRNSNDRLKEKTMTRKGGKRTKISEARTGGLWTRREFFKGIGAAGVLALWPNWLRVGEEPSAKVAFVTGDVYSRHDTGEFAYESAKRLHAVREGLERDGLWPRLLRVEPKRAGLEWIEAVHTPDYIETVKKDVESGARVLSTGHTLISRDSYDVALWAAGGALAACDEVMAGKAGRAFCAVRPPGHHASAGVGMGFCIFNNAAVAARYLQKKYGLGRVLIVDWDLHHGNGTQDIFYKDGSVFYFSTHQWPWYPWTGAAGEIGEGEGKYTTLNIPLPAGSGDRELIEAFEGKLRPAMDRFQPDFVLISAGFDSRTADPLGRFRVSDDGFRRLTEIVIAIARDHASGRLVSMLEGGYNLEGLASAVSAHVETLLKT